MKILFLKNYTVLEEMFGPLFLALFEGKYAIFKVQGKDWGPNLLKMDEFLILGVNTFLTYHLAIRHVILQYD